MRDYLTLHEVVAIHAEVIRAYGGSTGVRDPGAIEAALFRPQSGYYADIIAEAAALMESLLINHPFVDGNKRATFAICHVFLDINGYRLDAEPQWLYDRICIGLKKKKDDLKPWCGICAAASPNAEHKKQRACARPPDSSAGGLFLQPAFLRHIPKNLHCLFPHCLDTVFGLFSPPCWNSKKYPSARCGRYTGCPRIKSEPSFRLCGLMPFSLRSYGAERMTRTGRTLLTAIRPDITQIALFYRSRVSQTNVSTPICLGVTSWIFSKIFRGISMPMLWSRGSSISWKKPMMKLRTYFLKKGRSCFML